MGIWYVLIHLAFGQALIDDIPDDSLELVSNQFETRSTEWKLNLNLSRPLSPEEFIQIEFLTEAYFNLSIVRVNSELSVMGAPRKSI